MQTEPSNRVEVSFCVDLLPAEPCLSENQISQNFSLYSPRLAAKWPLYGAIVIRCAGQPEVRIDDELWVVVLQFCFNAIPALLSGQKFIYNHFSYAGQTVLAPDGAMVLISGEFVPQASIPRDDLLPALYDCGERFVHLLHRLSQLDRKHETTAKDLALPSEMAKAALSRNRN